ncbi:phosphotransferase [Streptomyces sp. H27-D2]|uniref:phosphotransferase n=1 Tax=Streptomyces sp. H27-D2 TaxID=3046304 RepID=UPI002DB93F87|nr:phosphotransferase [Streptomyces sp. H27-D2]MEC4020475.1 phosphotransferase [Streptomyces sp. H27-D2]
MLTQFTKHYDTPAATAAAARHYGWLAAHAEPLRQPALRVVGPTSLTFEHIDGRRAVREDLLRLAGLLGDAHGAAWASDLHRAQLNMPHAFRDGSPFGGFLSCREVALRRRLEQGYLPDATALHVMLTLLERSAEGPAAFYKDSNPRNFVITEDGTVFTVDTDDLTLAPFGYDLSKLIATLIMTHGPIGPEAIEAALENYNQAAARYDVQLGATRRERLDDFLALHSVLTAPYAGHHGYRYGWVHQLPCPDPEGPA